MGCKRLEKFQTFTRVMFLPASYTFHVAQHRRRRTFCTVSNLIQHVPGPSLIVSFLPSHSLTPQSFTHSLTMTWSVCTKELQFKIKSENNFHVKSETRFYKIAPDYYCVPLFNGWQSQMASGSCGARNKFTKFSNKSSLSVVLSNCVLSRSEEGWVTCIFGF